MLSAVRIDRLLSVMMQNNFIRDALWEFRFDVFARFDHVNQMQNFPLSDVKRNRWLLTFYIK